MYITDSGHQRDLSRTHLHAFFVLPSLPVHYTFWSLLFKITSCCAEKSFGLCLSRRDNSKPLIYSSNYKQILKIGLFFSIKEYLNQAKEFQVFLWSGNIEKHELQLHGYVWLSTSHIPHNSAISFPLGFESSNSNSWINNADHMQPWS